MTLNNIIGYVECIPSNIIKIKTIELIGVLEQFYTKEKQEQYGVLGIRIELI